ncbi:MAG TPA: LamG-like jellyroll fold domain-containing protein [Armatimonadota bacterium]|nr:LamG-like jellyroll fold domain-containing protein [Armatimonadota bacterium]
MRSCATMTLLLIGSIAAADVTYHVATRGDDANPGSAREPFATLARAQEAARASVGEGTRIEIRAGRYELDEPLRFGPEDTGTWAAREGHEVIISGGRRIRGWKRGADGLWRARIDEVAAGEWHFRELFVNGRRATRARTPDADAAPWFYRLAGAEQAEDLSEHKLMLDPAHVADWSNVADVEVVVFGEWAITRKLLESIDADTGVVILRPPHVKHHPAINPKAGLGCYFENVPEALDQPGEWYLDRNSGELTYYPLPGEKMGKAEVIAPYLERLVEVEGSAGLSFEGLTFSHCGWPLPEAGHAGIQGTFHSPPPTWGANWTPVEPALVMTDAGLCNFTGCTFADLGGGGVWLRKGSVGNTIEGCEFTDIAGNGVMVGEHYPGYDWVKDSIPEEDLIRENEIANNHIHACGQGYFGAVGVWVGFAETTLVRNNLIHDLPYTGVSVGWRWNETPTACKGNVIEHNHIHDVMNKLADGGCIYTLGLQPQTVLRGNVLHDVHYSPVARQSSRSNNGIFFDQGSKEYLVEDNVIYSTAGPSLRFNQCEREWHEWNNNHLGITVPVEGKRGTGLKCDGGKIEEPHSPGLDAPELTAEAWIYLDGFPSGGDDRRWIINKNHNEWQEGHWGLCTQSKTVGAYLNIGGGEAHMLGAFSDDVLTLDEWHHIAFTYDGADLNVYHNGTPVASRAINRARVPGAKPVAIGRRQDDYIAFVGRIDEAVVYSRALAASEVADRYEAGGAPPEGEAVEKYWAFEETDGSAEVLKKALELAGIQSPWRERLLSEDSE